MWKEGKSIDILTSTKMATAACPQSGYSYLTIFLPEKVSEKDQKVEFMYKFKYKCIYVFVWPRQVCIYLILSTLSNVLIEVPL